MTPAQISEVRLLADKIYDYDRSVLPPEASELLGRSMIALSCILAAEDSKQSTLEPDWLSIYQAYPRKVGRPSARKAILKALKSTDHASLLASVQRYAEYVKAAKTEECYIPHCSRWMNDERYNDPLPDPMAANPALRNAKVAHLKSVIRNSPAFPGGPRWTELHTPEEKSKYTEAASELLRLLPGFNMNELRR